MPQLKQLALQIFHETLAAIDIPATMQRKLRRKGAALLCGDARIDLRIMKNCAWWRSGKQRTRWWKGWRWCWRLF
jgi:hypothetical protein